ncbi:hypothetical protein Ahy_B04g071720 isoform A [Arachis hypogaea]|uniref:Uncharacterized protein n=1 Tax=Arachis hypogaea TaxID=3818 RepID=A0A444ZLE4_ARAHY|nr:hypothetical protein Ahy_B04g071720 isoform A [Arachis hypogaea]
MGREQNLTETLNYNRRHRRAVATAIATATATTIHLLDTSANATTCFDDFFSRCLFRRCVSSGCDTVTFEKEPMPSSPASGEESNEKKSFSSKNKFSSRNASSKYDFVKIPNHVAIKIALELKKLLIDNSLLYVSQSNLEVNLFKVMESRGYGEEYISHYKMMTRLVSSSKSSIGNPCLWHCLCWEVYYCHPACAEAKLPNVLQMLGAGVSQVAVCVFF